MAISSTPRISKLDILDCLPVVSSISNLVQVVAYKALNKPLPKGSLASHLFFSLPVLGNLYKITQLICRLFYPPKNAEVPEASQEPSLSEPTSPAKESEQLPNTHKNAVVPEASQEPSLPVHQSPADENEQRSLLAPTSEDASSNTQIILDQPQKRPNLLERTDYQYDSSQKLLINSFIAVQSLMLFLIVASVRCDTTRLPPLPASRRESFATDVEDNDDDFATAYSGEEEDRGLDGVPAPVFAEAAQVSALRLESVLDERPEQPILARLSALSASTITLNGSPVAGSSPEASPLSAYSVPSEESIQDRNKYQVTSFIQACGFTFQMAEFFVNHCLPTIERMELNQAESDRLQNLSYDLYFGAKQQLKADMATFIAQPKLTVTFDPAHNQFLVEKNKLTASWGVFTKPLLAIKANGSGMILETTGMVYGNMDLPLSFGQAQEVFAGKSFERCS